MDSKKIKMITALAMLSAFAYAGMYFSRALPPVVPVPPLKYDPKDIFIIIGGFLYGPLAAAAMSVLVSFIEMITVSTTGPVGLLMNIISTGAFAIPAASVYKNKRSVKGAVFGLAIGVVSVAAVMLLWNYIITPLYTGVPREVVAGMLIPVFLPFNLLKGFLNAALTMLIYKPLSSALRRMHMLPESDVKGTANLGVALASLFAVVNCILLTLVFMGII